MKYFTLYELEHSDVAKANGIDNRIPTRLKLNARHLINKCLDIVRAHVDRALTVSSGYRCPVLNAKVGGVKRSSHLTAQASDIYPANIKKMNVLELYEAIKELHKTNKKFKVDQCILEKWNPKKPDRGWVHISLKLIGKNRNQFFEIK